MKTLPSRLKSRINFTSTCWEWTGFIEKNKYGKISGKWAHRAVFEALKGPIPIGLTLDHLCRNRACVNPDHLEPVTRGENTRRGMSPVAIHWKKTECVNGHKLEGENLSTNSKAPSGNPARKCKLCNVERCRKRMGWKIWKVSEIPTKLRRRTNAR